MPAADEASDAMQDKELAAEVARVRERDRHRRAVLAALAAHAVHARELVRELSRAEQHVHVLAAARA